MHGVLPCIAGFRKRLAGAGVKIPHTVIIERLYKALLQGLRGLKQAVWTRARFELLRLLSAGRPRLAAGAQERLH